MGLKDALPKLRARSYSPSIRMTLEDALELSVSSIPPPGYPYFCRGYRREIQSWVVDSLRRQGATLVGPLTEIVVRGSCIFLWGPTDKEDKEGVYCKLVHPSVKEAASTAMILRLFPDLVVTPLSIDEKRNVLLSWDFGMTSLEELEAFQ